MRIYTMLLTVAVACSSTGSSAQMFQRIILNGCYDPNFQHNPKAMVETIRYADKAMAKYERLARSSRPPNDMFTQQGSFASAARHKAWIIDGVEGDPRTAKDPWIDASTRMERVGLVRSNDGLGVDVQWRAVGSNGSVLGNYDSFMSARLGGYEILKLKLYSVGAATQAAPLKPFCLYPGDIEERKAKNPDRN